MSFAKSGLSNPPSSSINSLEIFVPPIFNTCKLTRVASPLISEIGLLLIHKNVKLICFSRFFISKMLLFSILNIFKLTIVSSPRISEIRLLLSYITFKLNNASNP